jgi:hypothetical protein
MPAATIDQITLADAPESWGALGFTVSDGRCQLGQVELLLAGTRDESPPASDPASGVLGWSLRDVTSVELDGLPTTRSESPPHDPAPAHPNGVLGIDHIVAISPAFERSVAALQAVGMDLRRIREEPTPAGAPRQAFFRLGREILEVAERAGGTDRPARFWGLALLVADVERSAEAFAPHVSEVRAAVQPGRRIATVRRSAGLAEPLALMSVEEREAGEG